MFIVDQIAYTNRLRDVHPLEKFSFAMITMFIALMGKSFLPLLLIIFLMTYILIVIARVPAKKFFSLLSCPFAFLFMGVIGIIFNISSARINDALISLNSGYFYISTTQEGLRQGLFLSLRGLACVCCLYFLALTTPMVEIMSILKKIGVPSLFRELASLIYRSIFILFEMANYIFLSQNSRLGYSNVKNSYYSLSELISSVFLKAYTHSQLLHRALIARGYNGELDVIEPVYKFSKYNWIKIWIVETVLLIILFLR